MAELVRCSRLSKKTVPRIEKGKTKEPTEETLSRLASPLRTTLEYLLSFTNKQSIAPVPQLGHRVPPIAGVSLNVLGARGLFDTLEKLYPDYPLLEFNGEKVAALIFSAPQSQWADSEAPLDKQLVSREVPPTGVYDSDFDPEGESRFRELKSKERDDRASYWNDATYDMETLAITKAGCKLRCKMGRYFLQASTSEALAKELTDALAQKPEKCLTLEDLPRRRWLHRKLEGVGIKSPVLNGRFRSAAVGISVLTMFHDPRMGGYCFFVHPRSGNVLTYNHLVHVVPSGMFQPVVRPDRPELEYSVEHSILREFYEELYNAKEAQRPSGQASPSWFYNRRPVRRLRTMLAPDYPDKGATLYYTGIAVDLFNLKPDICALLLIRDKHWFAEESERAREEESDSLWLNDEYFRPEEAALVPPERWFDIDKLKICMELDQHLNAMKPELLSPRNLLPIACATIHLGLGVARRELGID